MHKFDAQPYELNPDTELQNFAHKTYLHEKSKIAAE